MLVSICADGLLMKFALCNTVLSALAEDARAGRVGCIWLVIHPVLQSSNSAITKHAYHWFAHVGF